MLKPAIDLKKKRTGEMQGEVDVSLPDCFVCSTPASDWT